MVRFCSSKGDPLWVRTFQDSNCCLLLQLRKHFKRQFIVLSQFRSSCQSRTIIFPEGDKADGWFRVTKIMKDSLINGYKMASTHHKSGPVDFNCREGQCFNEPSRCFLCLEEGTADHLLIHCCWASPFWHLSPSLMRVSRMQLYSVKDVVVALRRRMKNSLEDDSFGHLLVYLDGKKSSDFWG